MAGTRSGTTEPNVFRSISRHRRLVALITLAFGVAALVFGLVRTADYAADASVLLQDPRSAVLASTAPARDEVRYVADQIAILKSTAVHARASELVGAIEGADPVSARDLRRNTSIRTSEGSNVVVVRVSADDPEAARARANAIVRAYREIVRADLESETKAALRKLDLAIAAVARTLASQAKGGNPTGAVLGLLQELRSRRSSLQVDAQLLGDGVSLFLPAELGKRQDAPLLAIVLIALVLGGLVGIGVAYMLDARGQGFGRRLGVQAPVDPRTLAQIPDFEREGLKTKLPVLDAPGSDASEAFRFLAAVAHLGGETDGRVAVRLVESLQDEYPEMTERELAAIGRVASRLDVQTVETQTGTKEKGPSTARMIAFVASSTGDGTTTVVANTALAAAQAGDNVLVVDGDVGGRGLTRLLLGSYVPRIVGSDGKPIGLVGMILRGLQPQDVKRVMETNSGGRVSLIEPGSATLGDLEAVRPEWIIDALSTAGKEFDRVFIDVPPVLQVPHADPLLKSSSAVVVVVRHRSDPGRLEQVLDRLALLGVNPVGHVVNLVPPKRGSGRQLTTQRIDEARPPSQLRRAQSVVVTPPPPPAEEAWLDAEPSTRTPIAEVRSAGPSAPFTRDGNAAPAFAPPPESAGEKQEVEATARQEEEEESRFVRTEPSPRFKEVSPSAEPAVRAAPEGNAAPALAPPPEPEAEDQEEATATADQEEATATAEPEDESPDLESAEPEPRFKAVDPVKEAPLTEPSARRIRKRKQSSAVVVSPSVPAEEEDEEADEEESPDLDSVESTSRDKKEDKREIESEETVPAKPPARRARKRKSA
jgi:Mrp family chromosome partitioning ATPase/capsular polysaccharide biosynthesis protein